MLFDVEVPTCREGIFVPPGFGGPKEIVQTIREAERLGYNAVWGTDFVNPAPSMGIPSGPPPNWYEVMMSLAYAAAVTKTIKLATGVVLLPYRDLVILAKQVATIDRFSNGRFLLGLGLGGFRDEFEAIKPREKNSHRGRMFEEGLEALRLLLSHEQKEVSYKGEYVEFHNLNLNPKPVQDPLPMYVPGKTAESVERIARLKLGYMIRSFDAKERLEALRPALEKQGSDISAIDVVAEAQMSLAKTREHAIEKYKNSRLGYRFKAQQPGNIDKLVAANWIGTPNEVAGKLVAAKRQGIQHFLVLHITGDTMPERLEQMQMFAEEVVPAVKTA